MSVQASALHWASRGVRRAPLNALRTSLRDSGLSAAYVCRLMNELEDHFEDLENEALAEGRSAANAEAAARQRLGDQDAIEAAVLKQPELRSWCQRWPWLVTLMKPFVVVLLVPAMPILACVDRAPAIARWGVSISLASAITCAMLLMMAQALISSL